MRPLAALLPFVAAAIPAQQAAPPELLRIAVAGPASWRTRLLPTDIGSMLASAPAERMWRDYVAGLDDRLRRLRGDDAAFARERATLLDYGGTLHVVAWLEQAEDALHLPRWSAAMVAEPDGRTDLAAMVAAAEQWSARIGGELTNAWRDMEAAPVRCHEGRLLLVIAQPDDLARAVARAERFVGTPLGPRDVACCTVHVPALLGLVRDRPAERGCVRELLGVAAKSATLTIGSDGPRTALTFELAYGTGHRGLAGALLPPRAGVPALDWLAAAGASGFCTWQVDGALLWPAWVRVWAEVADAEPAAMAERMLARLGGDPVQALLPHLYEVVAVRSGTAGGGGAQVGAATSGSCLVLATRDETALLAAIAGFGPRLCTPLVEGDDGVRRGSFVGQDVAIGHGLVVFSSGEGGTAQAQQVLDLAAARPRAALSMREAPAGVSGGGRVDVTRHVVGTMCAALRWQLFALFGTRLHTARLPSDEELAAGFARWQALLQQHRLVAATLEVRSSGDTAGLRLSW